MIELMVASSATGYVAAEYAGPRRPIFLGPVVINRMNVSKAIGAWPCKNMINIINEMCFSFVP